MIFTQQCDSFLNDILFFIFLYEQFAEWLTALDRLPQLESLAEAEWFLKTNSPGRCISSSRPNVLVFQSAAAHSSILDGS